MIFERDFGAMKNSVKSSFALVGLLLLAFTAINVIAQEQEERRFEDVATQRVKALSQSTANALTPVREALAPEPEVEGAEPPDPNPQLALQEIRKINMSRIPGHEKAEVNAIYGYIYYLLEDNQRSKEAYRAVIDEPEANAPLVLRTMKTLAQLHLVDEEYRRALDLYLEWMSYQEIIDPNDHALVSIIYYQLEDLPNSLEHIEIAIGMREANGEIGQENWYSIQRSIHYQQGNIDKTIEILKKLIVYYPSTRYWRELGGMYAELERTPEQMAAYDLAWLQDGLESEGQIMGLAYMYISAGAPYQAAEIIKQGFDKGIVEQTEINLQTLGSALYQSRSLQEALPWMERAAEKADGGESFGRLAGIYVELERYEDALRVANEAIRRGGMRRPDLVRMQAGNALFNMYRYDEAIRMFEGIRDERSRKAASDWVKYVENERERERQLRASGIDMSVIRG